MPKTSQFNTALSIVILLCWVTGINSQCDICVDLTFYSCKVCYNNCTQNNQTQTFRSCQWTYCAEQYYDTTTNSTSCSRYQTDSLLQNQCFGQCCKSSQTYFSVEELNRCYNQSQDNIKIGIIVGSVIGGVFLLIFLICCICSGACASLCGGLCGGLCGCCGRICQCIASFCACLRDCFAYVFCCRCFRSAVIQEQPSQNSNNFLFQPQATRILSWQEEPKINEKINKKLNDEQENCAICLNNRANTVTKCGHSYHLECIEAWHKRNQHCPLCKSEDISDIKFFCRGCCLRFLKFNLKKDTNIEAKINEMKGPNCPTCQ